MIRNTAVWARAGLVPVAAALSLVCSAAFAADEAAPAEKDAAAATSEATNSKKTATSAPTGKTVDEGEASADKDSADKSSADDASTDSASTGKSSEDEVAAGDEADEASPDETAAKPGGEDKATESAAKPADEDADASTEAAAKPDTDDKSTEAAAKSEASDEESAPVKDVSADESDAEDKDTAATEEPAAKSEQKDAAAADKAETDKTKSAKAQTDKSTAGTAETVKAPESTAALQDHSDSAAPVAEAATQVLPPADPVLAAVRQKLPAATQRLNDDDAAALSAFYGDLNGKTVWVTADGLTDKGKAVIKEIRNADDWGLEASAFRLPSSVSAGRSADEAADDEITIAIAVLKYARYARGGRVNPSSISQLMDLQPPLLAPKAVLTDITAASAPDAYLRDLHPKHEQFQRLRKVLLQLRGKDSAQEEEAGEPEDPALAVKIPPGRLLRQGREDPQVALLRKRLKVPADNPADEYVYDEKVADAVRAFQRANRLRPDGLVGNNTRAVLNGRPKPTPVRGQDRIQLVLLNMERWRWMPADLGEFYVWDNVPEALTRVVKNGRIIHTDKIIVGQPSWPTPSFSADMKTVVFHPSWGVPPGIKRKELLPLLRKSSGGGLFGIFGGGYSSQAVLDAYHLRVYRGGRQIDPNQVDWNSANIAAYSFQQPPGPKNPLGNVKFMFPNKHSVYMHDTPERHLFSRSQRALSHGCMRIEEPGRFAEVILGEDKGWSPQKVRGMFNGYSSTVALDKHIPVHVTYVTARVDDNGRLRTYADVYGLDGRTARALTGRSIRTQQPVFDDDDGGYSGYNTSSNQGYQRRKKKQAGPQTLSDVIGNMFSP